jgi:threonyl-tRNA synthetase
MADPFITAHKAKHLLSHVLVVAGARHWPGVMLGESGETATGFYADFGLTAPPAEVELGALNDTMVRVLGRFQVFRDVQLSPAEAVRRFTGQPWKQREAAVMSELEGRVACYELDGFFDLCGCVLKDPVELRAVHPEKFWLTRAVEVTWRDRTRLHRMQRITGDLFPAAAPCGCCPGDAG